MPRLTEYLLPTEREPPADAEALSHILIVRAGLARQLGAGLWTWLPAGWRVHQKAVQIIREEMDAIGGMEMLMPVLQPAELWKRTGRYEIDELFKLKDRRGADMVLALSNEEPVTTHMSSLIRSYRDLPKILYHFQTKERDEPRPRAGVLRTREFIMKDSYTFDCDADGLDAAYQKHVVAYDRIFDRWVAWSGIGVKSDVGMMERPWSRRAQVGTLRRRRERCRARAGVRGERRGGGRRSSAGAASRGQHADTSDRFDTRAEDGRAGRRRAGCPRRRTPQGLPDRPGRW